MRVWPAILVCGVSFAVPQFLISNYVNPWIVDIGASLDLDGWPDPVPEGLAAQGDLAVAGAARPRRIAPSTMRAGASRIGASGHAAARTAEIVSTACCRGSSCASSC